MRVNRSQLERLQPQNQQRHNMHKAKSLLVTAVALMVSAATATAAWIPTGSTDILPMPQLEGQNARKLTLRAQLLLKEKNVVNGHVIGYRWKPFSGVPIQFRMTPSTGTEIRNGATDGTGTASVVWEVPRYNRSRRIGYSAAFDGGYYFGIRMNRASEGSSIFVNN